MSNKIPNTKYQIPNMQITKHYTIPFFIIHKGCPHGCIFCNQKSITGLDSVHPDSIPGQIDKYLSTIPDKNATVEVGFFGGSFTGLDPAEQSSYLTKVQPYLKSGQINGIRLSTRPDFIDIKTLRLLKENGVRTIELGVQSVSDEVLIKTKRGHTSEDVINASKMIIKEGFTLGHQMILGLPGSTFEDELATATLAKELSAGEVRIYPLIVMKNTELAEMWKNKEYLPLTEEESIQRAAQLIIYFNKNNIKVIRCGLHPSEGLVSETAFLAGPFHPAFRAKVESRIFGMLLDHIKDTTEENIIQLSINPQDEADFYGFGKENLSRIKKLTHKNKDLINSDTTLPRGTIKVTTPSKTFTITRKVL